MGALKQAAGSQLPLGGFGTGNMVSLDGGKRLRLDDKVDFWPGTGAWRAVEPRDDETAEQSGTGVTSMLAFLKKERAHVGQPVRNGIPAATQRNVICNYCRKAAELHGGLSVYPDRKDLDDNLFWVCWDCNAWVGCHRGSDKPFGSLANEELRAARRSAHAAFDPVWEEQLMSRHDAYAWLAEALGIPKARCHIGLMDADQCRQVTQIVRERFGLLQALR